MYKQLFRLSTIVTLCSILTLFSHILFAEGAWWDDHVEWYESHDKKNPPKKGAILFIGSSSIARWRTLEKDFAFADVINRGIGGTGIDDWLSLTDRIVIPYRPRLIVLYAGGNSITGGHSPESVLQGFQAFVSKIRHALPNTPIAFISIKPAIARLKFLDAVQQANVLIQGYIQHTEGLEYIDVFTPMLGKDGKPRKDIFVPDELHLNQNGYKLWAQVITPYLKPFAR